MENKLSKQYRTLYSSILQLQNRSNAVSGHPGSSETITDDALPRLGYTLYKLHGLGKLKGRQVKIHIDETVQPVAQPHRRIPFHVGKQLEEQLEKDEQQEVIERVDGPTPWVSPIVVAPKREPGKVRICIDMRQANKAIQRERHLTPTIK